MRNRSNQLPRPSSKPVLALLATCIVSTQGFALNEVSPSEEKAPLSGTFGLNLRSSTANTSEADYRLLLSGKADLSYSLGNSGSFGLKASGKKDLNRERLWTLVSTVVDYSYEIKLQPQLVLNLGVSYGLPVVKEELRYEHSKGSLGAESTLAYEFQGPLAGLNITLGLGYGRNLYAYTDNEAGKILIKWFIDQSVILSYKPCEKIVATITVVKTKSWNFNGDEENANLLQIETLAYEIDKSRSAILGHISDGLIYEYGGAASNVRAYDKYRSQVFLGAAYKF